MGCSESKVPATSQNVSEETTTVIEEVCELPSAIPIGRIEDYQLLEYISEGSSGHVFSALDLKQNKRIAVKLFGYSAKKMIYLRSIVRSSYSQLLILLKASSISMEFLWIQRLDLLPIKSKSAPIQ